MSDPNELQQLESELHELEERWKAERRAQRRASRSSLVLAAVFLGVFVGFGALNFARFRAELTPEKLGKSLEKELREVGPTALREVGILGQDLLPVYVEEWRKQLDAAWPEISGRLEQELTKLGDGLSREVHQMVSETEARALEKMRRSLAQRFPELADPSRQDAFARRVRGLCDDAAGRTLLEFDDLFSKDVARVQDAVMRFDVGDTGESTVDLQKKFLRLWLKLLDQEIMSI